MTKTDNEIKLRLEILINSLTIIRNDSIKFIESINSDNLAPIKEYERGRIVMLSVIITELEELIK